MKLLNLYIIEHFNSEFIFLNIFYVPIYYQILINFLILQIFYYNFFMYLKFLKFHNHKDDKHTEITLKKKT